MVRSATVAGLVRVDKLTAEVTARWGQEVGERANGYPTSWSHAARELERIRDLKEQETET